VTEDSESTSPGKSTSAYETFRRTKTFGSLDGVRASCIFAVLWHHSPHPPTAVPILGMGFLGVDMFFVVSGLLIVTVRLRERARAGSISLKNFYARRTLRIFPIYYMVVFGMTGLGFRFIARPLLRLETRFSL
jgi:peptidoglycan/LPS O-acetylase OafA/YrhL